MKYIRTELSDNSPSPLDDVPRLTLLQGVLDAKGHWLLIP